LSTSALTRLTTRSREGVGGRLIALKLFSFFFSVWCGSYPVWCDAVAVESDSFFTICFSISLDGLSLALLRIVVAEQWKKAQREKGEEIDEKKVMVKKERR
jgi:membrane protein implicated in regulation of membrane protease activity